MNRDTFDSTEKNLSPKFGWESLRSSIFSIVAVASTAVISVTNFTQNAFAADTKNNQVVDVETKKINLTRFYTKGDSTNQFATKYYTNFYKNPNDKAIQIASLDFEARFYQNVENEIITNIQAGMPRNQAYANVGLKPLELGGNIADLINGQVKTGQINPELRQIMDQSLGQNDQHLSKIGLQPIQAKRSPEIKPATNSTTVSQPKPIATKAKTTPQVPQNFALKSTLNLPQVSNQLANQSLSAYSSHSDQLDQLAKFTQQTQKLKQTATTFLQNQANIGTAKITAGIETTKNLHQLIKDSQTVKPLPTATKPAPTRTLIGRPTNDGKFFNKTDFTKNNIHFHKLGQKIAVGGTNLKPQLPTIEPESLSNEAKWIIGTLGGLIVISGAAFWAGQRNKKKNFKISSPLNEVYIDERQTILHPKYVQIELNEDPDKSIIPEIISDTRQPEITIDSPSQEVIEPEFSSAQEYWQNIKPKIQHILDEPRALSEIPELPQKYNHPLFLNYLIAGLNTRLKEKDIISNPDKLSIIATYVNKLKDLLNNPGKNVELTEFTDYIPVGSFTSNSVDAQKNTFEFIGGIVKEILMELDRLPIESEPKTPLPNAIEPIVEAVPIAKPELELPPASDLTPAEEAKLEFTLPDSFTSDDLQSQPLPLLSATPTTATIDFVKPDNEFDDTSFSQPVNILELVPKAPKSKAEKQPLTETKIKELESQVVNYLLENPNELNKIYYNPSNYKFESDKINDTQYRLFVHNISKLASHQSLQTVLKNIIRNLRIKERAEFEFVCHNPIANMYKAIRISRTTMESLRFNRNRGDLLNNYIFKFPRNDENYKALIYHIRYQLTQKLKEKTYTEYKQEVIKVLNGLKLLNLGLQSNLSTENISEVTLSFLNDIIGELLINQLNDQSDRAPHT